MLKSPETRQAIAEFIFSASLHWNLGNPTLGDLPMLTRVNAVDALFKNTQSLHIPLSILAGSNYWSPFSRHGPQPADTASPSPPPALLPTRLQRIVPHKMWVGLIPFPMIRDNILRAIQSGQREPRKLCSDLLCSDLVDIKLESSSAAVTENLELTFSRNGHGFFINAPMYLRSLTTGVRSGGGKQFHFLLTKAANIYCTHLQTLGLMFRSYDYYVET